MNRTTSVTVVMLFVWTRVPLCLSFLCFTELYCPICGAYDILFHLGP